MMKNKLFTILSLFSFSIFLAACDADLDQKVTKAVSSVHNAQAKLDDAKKLKSTLELIDNRSKRIDEILTVIEETNFDNISRELTSTTTEFEILEKDPRYAQILANVKKAKEEMESAKNKQASEIKRLGDLKDHMEPKYNSTIDLSTTNKDNNTDNPAERISINVKDSNGNLITQEVYSGKGILTSATHYEKDASGKPYEAHIFEYDPTTGAKTKQTEKNPNGQITSVKHFDSTTGSLLIDELYNNGILVGKIENKFQLVEGEPILNVLSVEDIGEEIQNKTCENGIKCVTTDKTHIKVQDKGQVGAPATGFFTQSLYFPNGLDIKNVKKCYDPITGNRVVEQLIFIDDAKRIAGINPVEYYVSTFNEDCTKLHCQVRHVKLHDFNEIDQDTCCDKGNPNCTDAE